MVLFWEQWFLKFKENGQSFRTAVGDSVYCCLGANCNANLKTDVVEDDDDLDDEDGSRQLYSPFWAYVFTILMLIEQLFLGFL